MLLDEPFSALDVPVRLELRRELRNLQRETGLATVLVTHDPEEAAFLSEELLVITDGAVLQSGPSRAIFTRPASAHVARLVGIENLHRATVATSVSLRVDDGFVAITPTELAPGTEVLWSVRPERVTVSPLPVGDADDRGALQGILRDVADVGTAYDLTIALGGGLELLARTWGALELDEGSPCRLTLDRDAIAFWPAGSSDESGLEQALSGAGQEEVGR